MRSVAAQGQSASDMARNGPAFGRFGPVHDGPGAGAAEIEADAAGAKVASVATPPYFFSRATCPDLQRRGGSERGAEPQERGTQA